MDFIEGLHKSLGYEGIYVAVDRFAKYTHVMALIAKYSAQMTATLYFDNEYKLQGLPSSIVSDRDKIFRSLYWKELLGKLSTQLQLFSTYHSKIDDQTERESKQVH